MTDESPRQRILDGRAWAEFCDTLKSAGDVILHGSRPEDALDRAEGFRYSGAHEYRLRGNRRSEHYLGFGGRSSPTGAVRCRGGPARSAAACARGSASRCR